jgi:hypothetical protein
LDVPFCLSCSSCPVLPVLIGMSHSAVQFCLSSCECPILPFLFYSARQINWDLEIHSLQPSCKWKHHEIFLLSVACPLAGSGKIMLSWD